ncbi:helix-turn-helix domain-containing protein [Ligilactobacillus murinus]|uniref:Helix-turn-helix domain-containing protein n=1 Tax=Ligilactobacillus murinus TaxID=1622 RepID=A0A4S2EQZ8_9LACO|nr:helix-turn-helix domain-containing protein [Ligilactobacillus murinus]TGY56904.1 helix-turn-helix domain-containing protein [Ligilactobacillus murinus]
MVEQEFTGSRLFLNIPAIVAHDKVLLKKAPKAILLFGEIYSMLNVTGKFYMSNNTLAKRLDCSRKSIINYINLLKKQGYIETENVIDDETNAIAGRMITLGRVVQQNSLGWSNGIHQGSETGFTQRKHSNRTSNTNDQNSKNSSQSGIKQLEEDFNKLWKLYPRKEGKKKAFEAYKRAIKNGTTNKEIQTGIVNYLTQIRVQRTNKQYIKQGSTWFNGECWNDEYNVGQERSPVNPKTVPSSAPADRTVADLEREQRESRRDAFPMQYKNHPEWFTDEDVQNIIEEFPELREVVAEIDRARATSDRNTA